MISTAYNAVGRNSSSDPIQYTIHINQCFRLHIYQRHFFEPVSHIRAIQLITEN